MDERARWLELRSHLKAARASSKVNDLDGAREHIRAALEIDPDCMAARALREEISNAATVTPVSDDRQADQFRAPLISIENWAKFEARVRQRRLERELATVRAPLDHAGALQPHKGPLLAAAGAFLAILLGAGWLGRGTLAPPPATQTAVPQVPEAISALGSDERPVVAQTIGQREVLRDVPSIAPIVSGPEESPLASLSPIDPPPAAAVPVAAPVEPPMVRALTPLPMAEPPPLPPPAPVLAPAPAPPAPAPVPPDDEQLVKQTLQRYRSAYDGLDARAARAVWPSVNASALERAFNGLVSQNLTFDDCRIQLNGAVATALCRGSARYTPKIGSRDTRVEALVWSFTLRKAEAGWLIDTLRAF